MKYTYTIVIGLLAILAVGAFFIRQSPTDAPVAGATETTTTLGSAPETDIQTVAGDIVTLSSVLERNSVINTWASWCPFCVHELPDFANFADTHEGKIDVIAVNRAESIKKGESFLEELGLSNSKMRVFYDEDESLYRAFGGFAMPETVFVDMTGEIRLHKRGPLTKEELEQITSDLGWQ